LFDNVWSCDDFDTTKADPDIYVRAAQRLGVSVEDVIFLDDNLNAIKTAKRAGMQVFGVYDASSADCATEMREVSHRYIQSFTELIEEESE
jgi:beta-phosphoglucomutase-like phosphatase (HAD superfamily)